MSDAVNHPVAKTIDVLAAGTLISAFLGWLPMILSIIGSIMVTIYYAIQIYESKSFENFCKWLRSGKTRE